VGSEPGSSQLHLFSHFHHFTAEPQRLPIVTGSRQSKVSPIFDRDGKTASNGETCKMVQIVKNLPLPLPFSFLYISPSLSLTNSFSFFLSLSLLFISLLLLSLPFSLFFLLFYEVTAYIGIPSLPDYIHTYIPSNACCH
jgi:hypothetical protein